MGCNCGGRRKPTPASAGVAAVADTRPHKWVVEFPDNRFDPMWFDQQWQANAAQGRYGGYPPRKVHTDQ